MNNPTFDCRISDPLVFFKTFGENHSTCRGTPLETRRITTPETSRPPHPADFLDPQYSKSPVCWRKKWNGNGLVEKNWNSRNCFDHVGSNFAPYEKSQHFIRPLGCQGAKVATAKGPQDQGLVTSRTKMYHLKNCPFNWSLQKKNIYKDIYRKKYEKIIQKKRTNLVWKKYPC